MFGLKVFAIMTVLLPAASARVAPHRVDFIEKPALRVLVPESAAYVGGEQFILNDAAHGEVQLFVDADEERHIRRIFWIQREGYLPTRPELHYNYGRDNARVSLG